MSFLAIIALLSINWIIIFLGLLLNLFIVMMNIIWWLKGKALQSIDIIMISLGSIRILLLTIYLFMYLVNYFFASIDNAKHHTYLITAIMCVIFCSLWWGTVLGVFYCVKITTYKNQLFMWLKMNISSMVPWMLIGSIIISLISSLPCRWGTFAVKFIHIDNGNISSNNVIPYLKTQALNLMLINLAGSIIPFLMFCVAIYLLIASVLKHTRNMNSNNPGFAKSQLEAHKNAIINMVSFLFFYLLYFISSNLMLVSLHIKDPIFSSLCVIFVSSYPSLHSILLIASNPKFKRSFLSAFQCFLSNIFSK